MSKIQDVLNVFKFLIELLREDEVYEKASQIKMKAVEEPVKEVKEEETLFGVPSAEILELMRKVEKIDKLKPSFDEPLLRKGIPEELRDNNEVEATHKTQVSMEASFEKLEKGGLGMVMKPKVEIVKVD